MFTQWLIMHCSPSLGYASGIASKLLEKKREGWANSEVELLYNCWTSAIDNTELDDYKNSTLRATRDVSCVLLDEDSHYLLRFFYFLEDFFDQMTTLPLIPLDAPLEKRHDKGLMTAIGTTENDLVNRVMKACVFPMLGVAALAIKAKKKRRKYPESAFIGHAIDRIIALDAVMRKAGPDHIRLAYETTRDAAIVMIDEDAQMRAFARRFLSEIAARKNGFNIEMHRQRVYWSWEHEYAAILKKEELMKAGIVEPDELAMCQDLPRYKRETLEELARLRKQMEGNK